MKPTIRTRQYLLGYKYNFETMYSRMKQPKKAFGPKIEDVHFK